MSALPDKYAEWVRQTCTCASCADVDPESILVNGNIYPDYNSMPQAGYLGLDYERSTHRVLVLGKNPAGGPDGDPQNDSKQYPRLLRIVDAPSLIEESSALQNLYNGWRPLKSLNLEYRVGLKPSEIVYANQILCRSDNYKPSINRGLISENTWKDVRPIYLSCFRNRVLDLIRILEPQHIIALGKVKKTARSWPVLLEQEIAVDLPDLRVKIWPVEFPTHYNRWSEADVIPIRTWLGILP